MAMCLIGLLVSGCSDFRKAIGTEKSSPDEFEVVVRRPWLCHRVLRRPLRSWRTTRRRWWSGYQYRCPQCCGCRLRVLEVVPATAMSRFSISPPLTRMFADWWMRKPTAFSLNAGCRSRYAWGVPDIGPIVDKVAEDQRLRRTMREGLPTDGAQPPLICRRKKR